MKKVWKLSVKYWSKSLSYISITQSIITQSRRKMSKLYTWNHYQETTEDDVNLLEERVPNLNSWPMCIYVFHIPRINQCPQSVLITLSWVFAYPSNKMEKCPQDENWMLNRLLPILCLRFHNCRMGIFEIMATSEDLFKNVFIYLFDHAGS